MRLFINTDTGALITAFNFAESIVSASGQSNTIEVKRADSKQFACQFGPRFAVLPNELAEPLTLKFGVKVAGAPDGKYVVSNYDSDSETFLFTKTGGSVFTDAVTATNTTLTSATAGFSTSDAGLVVAGAGIPVGTTIASVQSATSCTLSAATTATASGVTITITGRSPTYTVAPNWNTTKLNNLLGHDPEGFAEVTDIRCLPDVAASLDGKYFVLRDNAGTVGVWIDVDNNGTTIPAGASACARAIEVTGISTGDSAADVAEAVAAVIHADSKFTAVTSGSLVTVTDDSIGARTAAADGNTGFTITRDIAGSAPNSMADVPFVDLDGELEWTEGDTVTSSATFTVRAFPDINQGSEGVPADATPAYPAPGALALPFALNEVADNDEKLALAPAAGYLVRITGEGGRIEQFSGGDPGEDASWLVLVNSYLLEVDEGGGGPGEIYGEAVTPGGTKEVGWILEGTVVGIVAGIGVQTAPHLAMVNGDPIGDPGVGVPIQSPNVYGSLNMFFRFPPRAHVQIYIEFSP